ncbi:DUF397 domain-containing protein [Streptomyces sp. NPDC029080]|uniref:DUF397 domain-containing protein n=1 Tax=Streptomyces sp. NPDC029080 TaxID=3155017 RepID=UPI0033FA98F2
MTISELAWFKSSYSSSGSGDCIEVALTWPKSTHSSAPATVHVRDSKAERGPHLALSPATWSAFVAYAGA